MRMRVITILTIAFIPAAATGWSVMIPSGEYQMYGAGDVAVLEDGSTVVSILGPFEDPLLACISTNGELLWYRNILEKGGGSRAFESGGQLVPSDEGGFFACFHSEPRATGINTDVGILRMDNQGNVIWEHILGEEDDLVWMAAGMVPCSDGGLLVYGSPGTMVPGGYVMKLSHAGEREWITSRDEIQGYAVNAVETSAEDYFVFTIHDFHWNSAVYRISPGGTVAPPVEISPDHIPFQSISEIGDGNLTIASMPGNDSIHAVVMDHNMNMVEERTFPLPSSASFSSLCIRDEEMLVCGESGPSACMALLDPYGGLIWMRTYSAGEELSLRNALLHPEGIVAIGSLTGTDPESWAAVLVSTDPLGSTEPDFSDSGGDQLLEPEILSLFLDSPGWVVACSVSGTEDSASLLVDDISASTGLEAGYLWIPDWQSLSGTEGWLIYARPWTRSEGSLQEGLLLLQREYPDAYLVWVSQGWDRSTMSVEEFIRDINQAQ